MVTSTGKNLEQLALSHIGAENAKCALTRVESLAISQDVSMCPSNSTHRCAPRTKMCLCKNVHTHVHSIFQSAQSVQTTHHPVMNSGAAQCTPGHEKEQSKQCHVLYDQCRGKRHAEWKQPDLKAKALYQCTSTDIQTRQVYSYGSSLGLPLTEGKNREQLQWARGFSRERGTHQRVTHKMRGIHGMWAVAP